MEEIVAQKIDYNKLERNRKNVLAFYESAINRKDYDAASKYIGSHYIQHNPRISDGVEGFKAFIGYLNKTFPALHSDIKKIFVDGDFVILHNHAVREPGESGRAIIDIFRLEDGKVVEHWDVMQDIPENSLNLNGMF